MLIIISSAGQQSISSYTIYTQSLHGLLPKSLIGSGILKLVLLLVMYNVRSERELMATVPERLDWLLFLGYDIAEEIPGHSILSKARRRWGQDAFRRLFKRIVWQCVEAGLVDGEKMFCDSSLIDADASNNSVINRESLRYRIAKGYQILEERLDEVADEPQAEDDTEGKGGANRGMSQPRTLMQRSCGRAKANQSCGTRVIVQ